MFEKNMSVSTPIARFGKSVTPAKPQVNLGLVELEDMNCEVGNKLAVTEFPIMKAPMDLISETIDNLLTSVVVECNPKSSYKKPKIHSCNKCGKTFAQYKSSQKHKQSCSGLDKLLKVVTCSICKKGFSDKRSLQRHVKAIHAEKPAKVSYNCAECDISFCSKQKMQLHNSAKHGNIAPLSHLRGDADQSCPVNGCDFYHSKLSFLKAHMTRFHSVKVKINCSICPFKCYSKSGMVKHQKATHMVSSSELAPSDSEMRPIAGSEHENVGIDSNNIENTGHHRNTGISEEETMMEKDTHTVIESSRVIDSSGMFESSGMFGNSELCENNELFENNKLFENNELFENIDYIEGADDTNVNIDVNSDDLGDYILKNHLGKVDNFTANIIEFDNM